MTVTLKNNPYNKSFLDSKADIDLSNITQNGENRIRDIASIIYDYDNPIVLTGGQWYSFEYDVLVICSAPPKSRVYIVTKDSEEKEIVLSSDYTGSIGAPYTSFEFCKNTPFASFAYETPGNNISHTVTAYKRKVV